jgi:hypothetical protein
MTLSEGFIFSQSNLQDYLECQRRFQLRYLLQIAWPALEAQPATENENHLRMGAVFHYIIRQHQSGVPLELLTQTIQHYQDTGQNELPLWWDNYLNTINNDKLGTLFQPSPPNSADIFTEMSFSVPLGGFRVVAKYDLLIINSSGTATIIDWKTNRKRPPRRWLQERMQSRVYPFAMIKAGSDLNQGNPIEPEQVSILYWFANYPTEPEQLQYSREQYLADEGFLLDLINQIIHKSEADFYLTHNEASCRFCIYRSLCDRGVQAGAFDSAERLDTGTDDEHIEINMEQIEEIGF